MYNVFMAKEKKVKVARWDEQHTKKAQNAWQARLEAETGVSSVGTPFETFTLEKMYAICGELWEEVIRYGESRNLEVKNIVAIMGKDTRKTTVFVIFMWFIMSYYDKINGFLLRDTIDKATTQMRMQLRKSAALIANEYGIEGFQEYAKESSDGFYLVRDKDSKANQKIELLSFDSIIELGGFTTSNGFPAVFIYDELQNPNSAHKEIQSKEEFLANYKFIDSKNEGIEISTDYELPKWMPRHYFLSNRYVGDHPLNLFAEEHFPYYSHQDENGNEVKGVRDWMLEDPLNNNFVVHYVGDDNVKPEWEDFSKTLIVYGSKLSNHILRKSEEWTKKQLALIERGNEEDLAVIIGDLYEGYENGDNAYSYSRKEKITREVFEKEYAPYAEGITIAVDLDFSRQIRIRPKYHLKKNKGGVNIYRTIREKAYMIKCNGVSDDGFITEQYFKSTVAHLKDICDYIRKTMPQIPKVKIIMDDKKAQWVGRFNFGDAQNRFWSAMKVNFDQKWHIALRPQVMDEMQDTGFIIDIEDYSNNIFHEKIKNVKIKEGSNPKKREEKDRDEFIDDINADEYGIYFEQTKMAYNNRATRLLGGKNDWH